MPTALPIDAMDSNDHHTANDARRRSARTRAAWAIFCVWLAYSGALLWHVEGEQIRSGLLCMTPRN